MHTSDNTNWSIGIACVLLIVSDKISNFHLYSEFHYSTKIAYVNSAMLVNISGVIISRTTFSVLARASLNSSFSVIDYLNRIWVRYSDISVLPEHKKVLSILIYDNTTIPDVCQVWCANCTTCKMIRMLYHCPLNNITDFHLQVQSFFDAWFRRHS